MFTCISFNHDEALKRELELRGRSPRTFANYRSQLRRLAEFFSKDITAISVDECKDYLYHLSYVQSLGPDTINTARSAFLFFRKAVMNDFIDPYLIPKRKVSHTLPYIPTDKQIITLLNSISNLKYRAVLSLCYGSGLRISEAVSLRISDIDSKSMRVFVHNGKGNKERFTILSKYSLHLLREYFKRYRPSGDLLFPSSSPSKPMPVQNIRTAFRRSLSLIFIPKDKRITIHTLRHCFATHLLDAGTDIRTIQLLLGHKSINSSCIYLHLSGANIAKIVSPIDQGGDPLDL